MNVSDYKTIRLKKNAEIDNAMANVKKDLYNWKQASNMLKINKQSSGSTASTHKLSLYETNLKKDSLIRSGSLRDISRVNSGINSSGSSSRKNSSNSNCVKLRPISGGRSKKNEGFSEFDLNDLDDDIDNITGTEFLTSFKKNSINSNTNSKTSDRQYLYTNRPTNSINLKKNSDEIEIELVCLIFFNWLLKNLARKSTLFYLFKFGFLSGFSLNFGSFWLKVSM